MSVKNDTNCELPAEIRHRMTDISFSLRRRLPQYMGICADNSHAGIFPAGGQVVTEARQPKWSREETRARDDWFWQGDNCRLITREDFDEINFCSN